MKHLHPASSLLLAFSVLLAASSRQGMPLFIACSVLALLALSAARSHLTRLFRRSRWLLLTVLILFGWLTPGTPVAGIPGASEEGLLLAAENLARLSIALAIVAMLLTALIPAELVAGLRTLLRPLGLLGLSRDRLAVRLALTLEEVEASRQPDGDAPTRDELATLSLPDAGHGLLDIIAGCLAGALLMLAWLA